MTWQAISAWPYHGEDNIINVSAMLFMWTTLPAFGAAAYVPQIVMERSLVERCRLTPA